MRTIHFVYDMAITFSGVATNHAFTIKCIPHEDERQKITNLKIDLQPETAFEYGRDSFGNDYLYGRYMDAHDIFRVTVEGDACTGLANCVHGEEDWLALYCCQDSYTTPGPAITRAFSDFYKSEEGPLDAAVGMMHRVYEAFIYEPGATNVQTTGEEALQMGRGVCQDYSHVLISLCRMAKIPARYVVGMLEGEGASHAWVEVYQDGGWYALDPTNNLVVTDGHVTISHGRNYKDCIINRGVFLGGGTQTQSVKVTLT